MVEHGAWSVELRNVSKLYGSVSAVRSVSFGVKEGEFLTLLGPSGCGKTTTLRLIAGLEEPSAGEIVVRGKVINHLPPHKRDTALVFQDYALFPHKTVYENIAFGLRRRRIPEGEIKRRVAEVLDMVQLPGVGSRMPHQLSGGQQQRVALARALVIRPSVLLLDEPLSNLDQKMREHMRIEMKNIQRQAGITFIYVTHDQEEAMVMSDRIALMREGRLIQIGKPEEVYFRPANRFVAEFIGHSNFVGATIEAMTDSGVLVSTHGGQRLLIPKTNVRSDIKEVVVQFRPENVLVFAQRPTDLEARYQPLAGHIMERVFFGDRWCYFIDVDGHQIRWFTNSPLDLGKRSSVILFVDGNDCHVFDRHGGVMEE